MYHAPCPGQGYSSAYCTHSACFLGACRLMVKLDFEQAIKRALNILRILAKGIFLWECPLNNRKEETFTQTKIEKYAGARSSQVLRPLTVLLDYVHLATLYYVSKKSLPCMVLGQYRSQETFLWEFWKVTEKHQP